MNDGGSGLLALGGQTIVGDSAAMRDAVERASALAASGASGVLLAGESGTGKELLARGIHYTAAPYDPFLTFDCAAVPEHLGAAELFGTHPSLQADAPPPRRGLIELAGAGTLFVADATRLPLPLQRRLAAAIRERHAVREGGGQAVRVGCRVIVATSARPEGAMDAELHGVLAAARIDLPPLRERPGDVRLLARHFAGSSAALGEDALAALEAHPWPGNVRELAQVVERAASFVGEAPIRAEHLIVLHRTARAGRSNQESAPAAVIHIPAEGKTLAHVEGEAVALTLRLTRGNQSAAARILDISRPTLARKLREHGIAPQAGA